MTKYALTSGTGSLMMQELIFMTVSTHTLLRHGEIFFLHTMAITALVLSDVSLMASSQTRLLPVL